MKEGWVKLYRKIMEEPWYTRPSVCHLAIHLILSARVTNKNVVFNGCTVKINRGQVVVSIENLKKETGLTSRQIRTALSCLAKHEFLTCKTTNKYTLITICNYSIYQDKKYDKRQAERQAKPEKPTSSRQTDPPKSLTDSQLQGPKNGKNIYTRMNPESLEIQDSNCPEHVKNQIAELKEKLSCPKH